LIPNLPAAAQQEPGTIQELPNNARKINGLDALRAKMGGFLR
jgi:hypothetical protein